MDEWGRVGGRAVAAGYFWGGGGPGGGGLRVL